MQPVAALEQIIQVKPKHRADAREAPGGYPTTFHKPDLQEEFVKPLGKSLPKPLAKPLAEPLAKLATTPKTPRPTTKRTPKSKQAKGSKGSHFVTPRIFRRAQSAETASCSEDCFVSNRITGRF